MRPSPSLTPTPSQDGTSQAPATIVGRSGASRQALCRATQARSPPRVSSVMPLCEMSHTSSVRTPGETHSRRPSTMARTVAGR